MSRILDAQKFRWTPSYSTDVMATFKKHGFTRTTPKQRKRPEAPANNIRYLSLKKRAAR
jgi:hypothetical protein